MDECDGDVVGGSSCGNGGCGGSNRCVVYSCDCSASGDGVGEVGRNITVV